MKYFDNSKRTMNERLSAARENSSVGHGAQGTKPLTWQQRERTEESADAAPTSIYAARRGVLGGEGSTCPRAHRTTDRGLPTRHGRAERETRSTRLKGGPHRYTKTVRRQARAQCHAATRPVAGPWSFALGDSTCENSLQTSIHNVGAD